MGALWSSDELKQAEEDLQIIVDELKSQTLIDKLKGLNLTNSKYQTQKITDDFMNPISSKIQRLSKPYAKIKELQKDSAKLKKIDETRNLYKQLEDKKNTLLQMFDYYKNTGEKAQETLKCIDQMKDKAVEFKNSLNYI